jgi:cell division septation protein DedD
MVTRRICGQVGVALLAVVLAAGLVGAIAPVEPLGSVGSVGSVGQTGPIAAGATAPGAASEGPDTGSNVPAAIDPGYPQVENGSRITFEHTGGERASYELTVSGSIEAGPEADLEDAQFVDRVSARRASGSVAEGGADDYFFTGEITGLTVEGPVTVSIDGEEVNPEEVGPATTTTDAETAGPTSTTTATATTTTTPTPTARTTTTTATATTATTATATASTTPTGTAEPTATARTTTAAPTRTQPTTAGSGDGGGSTGLNEQERGLFLTIGGVVLLGIVAIVGVALLARR